MDFVFALVERRVFGLDVDLDFSYMTYHRATFFFSIFCNLFCTEYV